MVENEVHSTESKGSSISSSSQMDHSRSSPCPLSCLSAKKSPLVARIISGSVGSIITSLVVTPLEVAKVRTQTQSFETASSPGIPGKNSKARVAPCPKGCGKTVLFNGHMDCLVTKENFPSAFSSSPRSSTMRKAATSMHTSGAPKPSGVVSVLRNIFLQEGLSGIYAGLRPTLIMAVPNTVLYFSIYEELIWKLRKDAASSDTPASWYFPLVAGAAARTVASTATAPFEYIRTRQAAGGSAGMLAELQAIVQTDGKGILALYQGLRPTLWRDIPFSALYWFCIEEFRSLWKSNVQTTISPVEQAGQEFLNGAVAGMIAAAFTTPFDVVKTRQQTQEVLSLDVVKIRTQTHQVPSLCCHNGAVLYETAAERLAAGSGAQGTFQCMRQIVAQEGVASLWRGNQARMLKIAPSCAIMIASYEFGKRIL